MTAVKSVSEFNNPPRIWRHQVHLKGGYLFAKHTASHSAGLPLLGQKPCTLGDVIAAARVQHFSKAMLRQSSNFLQNRSFLRTQEVFLRTLCVKLTRVDYGRLFYSIQERPIDQQ
jgi:hypothetical protein